MRTSNNGFPAEDQRIFEGSDDAVGQPDEGFHDGLQLNIPAARPELAWFKIFSDWGKTTCHFSPGRGKIIQEYAIEC